MELNIHFSTQQHVHDVQCLGMASASSVTFHAWAWPRRPIIELEFVRMGDLCTVSPEDAVSDVC